MLRFSPEGTVLVVLAGGELRWAVPPSEGELTAVTRVAASPGGFDAVYLRGESGAGELWAVADRARPVLSRWRLSADGVAEPAGRVELVAGGADRLVALPGWPSGVAWLGQSAEIVREEAGQLARRALAPGTEFVVALPPARLVVLRQGRLWLEAGADSRLLAAAGDLSGMQVLDGGAVAHERQIALVFERDGVQTLTVVETSDGTIEQRTNLKGIVAARFASGRGVVVLRRGERQLVFFDVARGRLAHTWDVPVEFVDFAVDAGARWLALELAGSQRAAVLRYEEVLAGRIGALAGLVPVPVVPSAPPGSNRSAALAGAAAALPVEATATAPVRAPAPAALTPVRLSGISLDPEPSAPQSWLARKPAHAGMPEASSPASPARPVAAPPVAAPPPPAPATSAPHGPIAAGPASSAAQPAPRPPSAARVPAVTAPAPSLDAQPLIALEPRPLLPPTPRNDTLQYLERLLEYIGALCEQAIALGWDSGRISYAGSGPLPFAEEVAALLNRAHGRAEEAVTRAAQRVGELETSLRNLRATLERVEPGRPPTRLLPASQLAAEFGLSELATRILLIVAAPALWGEIARLYAIAANDKERAVCDELLVCQLLSGRAARRDVARELKPGAPLLRNGLIVMGKGLRPFAGLTVDPALVGQLCGESFDGSAGDAAVTVRGGRGSLAEIALAGSLREQVVATLGRRAEGGPARIVLRGRAGSGRRTLLATLARQANRQLGVIDVGLFKHAKAQLPELLQAELRASLLRGWLPCLSGLDDLAADEPALRERVREVVRVHPGPLAFRCALEQSPPIDPGYISFDIEPMSEAERGAFWTRTLAAHGLPTEPAEYLAARYRVGPGAVVQVTAQLASRLAAPGGSNGHTGVPELTERLEAGLRQHRDARIAGVAQRLTRLATWDSVVLPSDVIDSIKEFISRIKYRRTVYEQWGFDSVMTTSRGLTALFQGGPGTGKSMVAGIIARELGYDLYRVDMSRILSKWIGETEKNLAGVFDAAEDGQAIILFDEADALFARRTDVKSSNDRYANIETNYLLQRLDTLEGIAILTTNLGGSIDPAFKRRMTLRLTFPFPDEEQRAELWRVHIPQSLPTEGKLDLGLLAKKHQLSGGYIRNAVLRAAFLAAQDQRPLAHEHLERAIRLEFREMGKLTEGGILE